MGETLTSEMLEDILAAQVDALLRDDDPTDALVAVYTAARDLLTLARRLYRALVPVVPNPGFIHELKRELVGAPAAEAQRTPAWLRSLANIPPSVKVAGIALGAGLSILALRPLLARLAARSTPAKSLPASADA